MNSPGSQVAGRDFTTRTLRALAARGIALVGVQAIPGDSPMPMANASRGYLVDDNGTARVWTRAQVVEAAN